jgi:formin-binding protein 1
MSEEARMRSSLQTQLAALDRTKKAYEKTFKETEKALDEYQKADADLNLSRAVVEKARINMVAKNQQCEDAKKDYANQLEKTNELQVITDIPHFIVARKVYCPRSLDDQNIKCTG